MIPSFDFLQRVSLALGQNQILHSLGGSGLLWAHGIVSEVGDWDLCVEADKSTLLKALQDFHPKIGETKAPFCSDFILQVQEGKSQIEIISHFRIQKDSTTYPVPLRASAVWKGVPLANLEDWLFAYKLMGREKKVELIEKYLAQVG